MRIFSSATVWNKHLKYSYASAWGLIKVKSIAKLKIWLKRGPRTLCTSVSATDEAKYKSKIENTVNMNSTEKVLVSWLQPQL